MKHFIPGMTLLISALLATAAAAESPRVVTGGVGQTSQEAIEKIENAYNLKLVFTGEDGMYLSDVAVSIRDSRGHEVINGTTDGPFLLADLKPGSYTVEAQADQFNNKTQVRLGETLKTYQVQFPVKDNIEHSGAESLRESGYTVSMNFPG